MRQKDEVAVLVLATEIHGQGDAYETISEVTNLNWQFGSSSTTFYFTKVQVTFSRLWSQLAVAAGNKWESRTVAASSRCATCWYSKNLGMPNNKADQSQLLGFVWLESIVAFLGYGEGYYSAETSPQNDWKYLVLEQKPLSCNHFDSFIWQLLSSCHLPNTHQDLQYHSSSRIMDTPT